MGRSESASASSADATQVEPSALGSPASGLPASRGWRSLVLGSLGGVLTGALLAGALAALKSSNPSRIEIASVPKEQLDEATLSIDRSAAALAEEARQCKTSLSFVTLQASPGQPATIRIRSGSYLSPSITVMENARRVAVPFPAPYAVGKGSLSIEGKARGLNVWLNPGRHFTTLDGAALIHVVWTPKAPCS